MGVEVKTIQITTMEDYLQCIVDERLLQNRWIMRGQSNSYDNVLMPNIGRIPLSDRIQNGTLNELNLFQNFRRTLPLHGLYLDSLSDIDVLAIAQHYRLKTRLLDWTTSPFVALYFACDSETSKSQPVVYACRFNSSCYQGAYNSSSVNGVINPFSVENIFVYAPQFINRRIHSQRGVFTVHPFNHTAGRYESINATSTVVEEMIVMEIKDHIGIKMALETIGLSPLGIYDTLEATADYVNNWKIW